MTIYVWSIGLVIVSQILYHLAQKQIPGALEPFSVMAFVYALASLGCVVFALFTGRPLRTLDFGQLLSWPVVLLALSIIGIEVGYLLAYRNGWTLGIVFALACTLSSAALAIIAVMWFGDRISAGRVIGLGLALVGTWLLVSRH